MVRRWSATAGRLPTGSLECRLGTLRQIHTSQSSLRGEGALPRRNASWLRGVCSIACVVIEESEGAYRLAATSSLSSAGSQSPRAEPVRANRTAPRPSGATQSLAESASKAMRTHFSGTARSTVVPSAALRLGIAGFMMCHRGDEEFRLNRSAAGVGCCRNWAAQSEMSVRLRRVSRASVLANRVARR